MKLDANWKVKNTPDLINMLHGITLLHFKDFERALYGEGNYRLYGEYTKCPIPRNVWKKLAEVDRQKQFSYFIKNNRYSKEGKQDYIVSTYSNVTVPALNVAKKPGQKSRLRETKTNNLKKRTKDLRVRFLNKGIRD